MSGNRLNWLHRAGPAQVPEVMGKPWYEEAFLPERKIDPSATPARDEPNLVVSLSLLEEVACEILDLYAAAPAAKGMCRECCRKPEHCTPVVQRAC